MATLRQPPLQQARLTGTKTQPRACEINLQSPLTPAWITPAGVFSMMRQCRFCSAEFLPKAGQQFYCKRKCAQKAYLKRSDRKYHRENYWRSKGISITLLEYRRLYQLQEGKCSICNTSPKGNLSVDHNHQTGKVRGLLCSQCNLGLGIFQDNPNLLLKATAYLFKEFLT